MSYGGLRAAANLSTTKLSQKCRAEVEAMAHCIRKQDYKISAHQRDQKDVDSSILLFLMQYSLEAPTNYQAPLSTRRHHKIKTWKQAKPYPKPF